MERKGVSTYISVLLLIVVVIAGGILIYGYTMGWFGRLGGEGEMGMVSLDSAYADSTNNNILCYVRNVGGSAVTLGDAYVNNVRVGLAGNLTIAENMVEAVNVTGASLVAGTTYEVKIVATDNTQITFSVKAD
jgi:hypothetical protein